MAVQLVDSRFLAELSVLLQRTSVRCGVYCVLLSKRCAYEVDSRGPGEQWAPGPQTLF